MKIKADRIAELEKFGFGWWVELTTGETGHWREPLLVRQNGDICLERRWPQWQYKLLSFFGLTKPLTQVQEQKIIRRKAADLIKSGMVEEV